MDAEQSEVKTNFRIQKIALFLTEVVDVICNVSKCANMSKSQTV